MRLRCRNVSSALAVAAVLCGPPARRTAAAEASPAAAPEVKADARARFDQGLKLFEKGENAAALAEFQRAYALIPNPTLLYNIGLVQAAMGRPVEAVDALEKLLADESARLSVEQRRHATQVRDEQLGRIALVVVLTDRPATVEIDGVESGRTPLSAPLRVSSGVHVVSVVAPGCLPSRKELTLAGRTTETLTVSLLPTESSAAHLAMTVDVPGAEVLVNGQRVGTTPLLTSVAVPPGAAHIEVQRAGYLTATRDLHLDQGATGTVGLSLAEDPATPAAMKGRLLIAVSETGGELRVDGAVRSLGSEGVRLVVGPHVVRVARAGFEPYERPVEIAPGRDTSLVVNLTPTLDTKAQYEDSAHARRVVGWSVVGAGALLAIGAGVYTIVTRNDVSHAQANLDAFNHPKLGDPCGDPLEYNSSNCPAAKSALEDNVHSAKVWRVVGYAGIGLGLVTAGVGTYLIATSDPEKRADPAASRLSLWGDGAGGGVLLSGRF